eukprot:gene18994-biopygen12991
MNAARHHSVDRSGLVCFKAVPDRAKPSIHEHRLAGGCEAALPGGGRRREKRQRTRTGRGPHDGIQRNGRGPGADRTRAWPFVQTGGGAGLKGPVPAQRGLRQRLALHRRRAARTRHAPTPHLWSVEAAAAVRNLQNRVPGITGNAVSPALASRCSYGGPGMVQHVFGNIGSRSYQSRAGPCPVRHHHPLTSAAGAGIPSDPGGV